MSIDSGRTKVHIVDMTRQQLIRAIRDYAEKTGLSPSTITLRAVNNSRLYDRLERGGDCTTEIAGRLAAYMVANPATAQKRAAQ